MKNLFAQALANLDFPTKEDRWILTGMLYENYSKSAYLQMFLPERTLGLAQVYARDSVFELLGHNTAWLPAASLAVLFRCFVPGKTAYPLWDTQAGAEFSFPWMVKLGFPFDKMQDTADAIASSATLDRCYAEVSPLRKVIYNAFVAAEFYQHSFDFQVAVSAQGRFLDKTSDQTIFRRHRIAYLQSLHNRQQLFYGDCHNDLVYVCKSNIKTEIELWQAS